MLFEWHNHKSSDIQLRISPSPVPQIIRILRLWFRSNDRQNHVQRAIAVLKTNCSQIKEAKVYFAS